MFGEHIGMARWWYMVHRKGNSIAEICIDCAKIKKKKKVSLVSWEDVYCKPQRFHDHLMRVKMIRLDTC